MAASLVHIGRIKAFPLELKAYFGATMPQGADRGKIDAHCGEARLSVMTADDFVAETPVGSLTMQRVTMTIDDELMDSLDAYMRASGHQNRSEAVRDLVRAGLMTQPRIDDGSRRCMAALVYVYDHETRQLSKRLMNDHHSHSDLSIAAVHVHVDAESCLEVSLLRGPKAEVEHFAQHVIGERGVRYGRLVVVPASAEGPAHDHGHDHDHEHEH
jgi:CopG family nickel-responsive transcriptional regulator